MDDGNYHDDGDDVEDDAGVEDGDEDSDNG